MSSWYDGRTVLVTGGNGFLGSHVVETLKDRERDVTVAAPPSDRYDLRRGEDIRRMLADVNPDTVIHLAATVGGIGAIDRHPGRHFYENAIMGIELLEQARRKGVEKCTVVGSACAYPASVEVPFSEDDLFEGYPEETNAPYGLAKRALVAQGQAYRREYGFNCIHLIPVNLFGPRDTFDIEDAHVIPALIRKCIEARETGRSTVTAWGTGSATRDFLYVKDAAVGILDATAAYNDRDPVNLGSGMERSIRDVLEVIVEETGFSGQVEWDTSKPDGTPRRCLDTSRAREQFGWKATTGFREGIQKTISWYERHRVESNWPTKE